MRARVGRGRGIASLPSAAAPNHAWAAYRQVYLSALCSTVFVFQYLAQAPGRAYPHICALLEWPGPFFFSLPSKFQFHSHFLFPLGYSGGISVPTRSAGALVLPLRPSCLSHPSP